MERVDILLEPVRAFLAQVGAFLPRLALAVAVLVCGFPAFRRQKGALGRSAIALLASEQRRHVSSPPCSASQSSSSTAAARESSLVRVSPDFAAIANASGLLGIRVEDAAQLEDALTAAFDDPGV